MERLTKFSAVSAVVLIFALKFEAKQWYFWANFNGFYNPILLLFKYINFQPIKYIYSMHLTSVRVLFLLTTAGRKYPSAVHPCIELITWCLERQWGSWLAILMYSNAVSVWLKSRDYKNKLFQSSRWQCSFLILFKFSSLIILICLKFAST